MHSIFSGYMSIIRFAALALVALCFLQAPVRAQETTRNIIFPSVGVASDQNLSLTLFNPTDTPVQAQAQLHHSGGMLVGLGDGSVRFLSASIQAGAFHSFKFKRSDILLRGEDGTDRVQILPSVHISKAEPWAPTDRLAVSMETISISDGTSNTLLVSEVIPSRPSSGGGRDILVGGDARDVLMGIGRNQTARVTVYHPSRLVLAENGSYEKSEAISGHVKVFDGSGNLIAQSPELVIPPGEHRSFEYNPYITVDYVENRAQVRIKPFLTFESKRLPALPADDRVITSLVSFEVVDNATGKTVTLSGRQCLAFYLGGIPN